MGGKSTTSALTSPDPFAENYRAVGRWNYAQLLNIAKADSDYTPEVMEQLQSAEWAERTRRWSQLLYRLEVTSPRCQY